MEGETTGQGVKKIKNGTESELERVMREKGLEYRGISIAELPKLEERIFQLHQRGILETNFFREAIINGGFSLPEDFPGIRSLIVVAYPQLSTRLVFTAGGRNVKTVIPPAYRNFRNRILEVKGCLEKAIAEKGFRVDPAFRLPLKALAAGTGLGAYGRNNIIYVSGMGSYHQILAFFTDMDFDESTLKEPRLLELCQDCRICEALCPSGAIAPDRFLLKVRRCLAYVNDAPPEYSFPEWVESGWHNAIYGCMLCQEGCPANENFLENWEEEYFFSEEETQILLEGVPEKELPPELKQKLGEADLLGLLERLPRNLGSLLHN